MSTRATLALTTLAALTGCMSAPAMYPGVTFVEPSEVTSERLHATCEYLDVVPTGTHLEAGATALQRGGNFVMPLGGVQSETASTSSTVSGDYVYTTYSRSWSTVTMVAIFRCGGAPVALRR